MKYIVHIVGIVFLTIVFSVCVYLFAGSHGFVTLPSVSVWARPVIVYIGESRVWLVSDPHNHWEITVAIIDPQTPGLRLHEMRLFSMPIPGPFNPLPFYPPIIHLW